MLTLNKTVFLILLKCIPKSVKSSCYELAWILDVKG